MYSWELDRYLKDKSFCLDKDEYLFATDVTQHPQIVHIKYEPFCGYTSVFTSDGYGWQINIKK